MRFVYLTVLETGTKVTLLYLRENFNFGSLFKKRRFSFLLSASFKMLSINVLAVTKNKL
jgi:hypothetical protein